MNNRTPRKSRSWPCRFPYGEKPRHCVTVYRRKTPGGSFAFMVANYADGKRRFDSYVDEAKALEEGENLAKRLKARHELVKEMTREEALDYASAIEAVKPLGLKLTATAHAVAECLKLVPDLPHLIEAARFYAARHKRTVPKRVAEVASELLAIKKGRGASDRYLQDLRYRLGKFGEDFQKDACNVTTAEIQAWLDALKCGPQAYVNFRRVLHLLFEFATARGYASDNPVGAVENLKIRAGEIEIFTPEEIARLLAAASPEFLPCLAIGAFAGLRSAEIERLEWSDVDLASGFITVGASRAKTASRRVVPIAANLAPWLAPYARHQGRIWKGTHDAFYEAQQATAAATEIKADIEKGIAAKKALKWKSNALRHSYASYRFAEIGDAGRVAGELGNSAAVVHRHYRELVKPADAVKWFAVSRERPANVAQLNSAVNE